MLGSNATASSFSCLSSDLPSFSLFLFRIQQQNLLLSTHSTIDQTFRLFDTRNSSLNIMSVALKESTSSGHEKISSEEKQEKINEMRRLLGPLPDKLSIFCSDASISRYLRARNWNIKKATKMLKETLKWRSEYKPEDIRWEEIAAEAETGKIYRSTYVDKYGRAVLVMRPGFQNTKSTKGQIKYLVYCMENAILNLPPEQEQMLWLIDFQCFNMSNVSLKAAKETAHILQIHYPERLGVAILYNPPKIFESFWMVVKPFLEPKTARKVKFVYSDDLNTKKIVEDLFDMDKLEVAFGGNSQMGFNIVDYAERMKEDDKKMPAFWTRENALVNPQPTLVINAPPDQAQSESESDESGENSSFSHGVDSEEFIHPDTSLAATGNSSGA
ncbi:hypothetical protein NE237_019348 [Protea cynaroides]|uniref:CRAL-TRIO domain-containing protein n=1 Tax=Protea cynaroides TaxID=273540 RepID=A0A9Q0QQ07_9MAGN|nr:hypothetical protein NE237_019348 [Protea cynaroides]